MDKSTLAFLGLAIVLLIAYIVGQARKVPPAPPEPTLAERAQQDLVEAQACLYDARMRAEVEEEEIAAATRRINRLTAYIESIKVES